MNSLVRIALSTACLIAAGLATATPPLDGISFAVAAGKLYVPLDEASRELGWMFQMKDKELELNGHILDAGVLRRLPDGSVLVPLDELGRAGATVTPGVDGRVEVGTGKRSATVLRPPKRVEISLAAQRLRAWQGDRLVLESRISSGRRGSTPAGDFTAGPYKARMHYSKRYHNAPMPWSVQIRGHVFIHGFTSVPDYPASHGCIRLPLNEGNPARFFYEWIDPGTPVKVTRE
jgi:hypothetical protein